MKKLLVALLFVPSLGMAQNVGNTQDLLSLPGLSDALAQAAKSSKAIGLVDLNGNLGTGLYLPLRTFHDAKGTNYFSVGPEGSIKQNAHFRPSVTGLADWSALVRRWESFDWYNNHVTKYTLPDFWLGPKIQTPFPGDHFQWKDWRDYLSFAVAIGF